MRIMTKHKLFPFKYRDWDIDDGLIVSFYDVIMTDTFGPLGKGQDYTAISIDYLNGELDVWCYLHNKVWSACAMNTHGTKISWTHLPGYKGETWNPILGCVRVSEGCRFATVRSLLLALRRTLIPHFMGLQQYLNQVRRDGQMRYD